jgi:hypothetical protein
MEGRISSAGAGSHNELKLYGQNVGSDLSHPHFGANDPTSELPLSELTPCRFSGNLVRSFWGPPAKNPRNCANICATSDSVAPHCRSVRDAVPKARVHT